MSDVWEDEGFGSEDDWEGTESVGADLEDDALVGFDDEVDDDLEETAALEEDDD